MAVDRPVGKCAVTYGSSLDTASENRLQIHSVCGKRATGFLFIKEMYYESVCEDHALAFEAIEHLFPAYYLQKHTFVLTEAQFPTQQGEK